MDYVIVVQAPGYLVEPGVFATESAFAEHLKVMRTHTSDRYTKLVFVGPSLSEEDYRKNAYQLAHVNSAQTGVEFWPAFPQSLRTRHFWSREVFGLWRRLDALFRTAGVVQSGISDDLWRPLMALANLVARVRRVPVVFVVDIDFRRDSGRYLKSGLWRRKRYLAHRLVYDPLKWIQVWLAPRMFNLVLLKSPTMARDFGKGRRHVRDFLDTVHAASDVISPETAVRREEWVRTSRDCLLVIYFGRLIDYKGLDRAITAVAAARSRGADVRLRIVGDGDKRAVLEAQVNAAGLQDVVTFVPPVRYGPALFELIDRAHLCIATPLVEDTPRGAFDAMARGVPVAAFDIDYYRDLARSSGAVATARWLDTDDLAALLVRLHADRGELAQMSAAAVRFARDNTQDIWLHRRIAWLDEVARPQSRG